jgi:hypothetical protein
MAMVTPYPTYVALDHVMLEQSSHFFCRLSLAKLVRLLVVELTHLSLNLIVLLAVGDVSIDSERVDGLYT